MKDVIESIKMGAIDEEDKSYSEIVFGLSGASAAINSAIDPILFEKLKGINMKKFFGFNECLNIKGKEPLLRAKGTKKAFEKLNKSIEAIRLYREERKEPKDDDFAKIICAEYKKFFNTSTNPFFANTLEGRGKGNQLPPRSDVSTWANLLNLYDGKAAKRLTDMKAKGFEVVTSIEVKTKSGANLKDLMVLALNADPTEMSKEESIFSK